MRLESRIMRPARLHTLSLMAALLLFGCAGPRDEPPTLEHRLAERSARTSTDNSAHADAPPPTNQSPPPARPAPDSAAHRDEPPASPTPPAVAIRADTLEVNGEVITVLDILEPIREKLDAGAKDLGEAAYYEQRNELVRRQIVEQVAERLIWQEAKQSLDETINTQLDKIVDRMEKDRINREFDGREANYQKHLAATGRKRSEVREMLRRSIVVDKYLHDRLLPRVPTPRKRDLQKYYESHRGEFSRPQRREMFLIDVPVAAFLDPRRAPTDRQIESARLAARDQIEQAYRALQEGRSFEEVARQYSHGLYKEKGGSWGWITAGPEGAAALQDRWEVPSRRLFELAEGQYSEILEAAKSFFIVKAGKIEHAATDTFQDAQPAIITKLRLERYARLRGEFLQKRLEESHVGSLDEFYQKVLAATPEPRK